MRFSEVFDFLYEWLSIFLLVFVRYIFVRKTIHFFFNGFSSCTFLWEWLSIFVVLVFFMLISVQMTFHFFFNRFSECTFLYEWLSVYVWLSIFFSYGFSSCTFLYEWHYVSTRSIMYLPYWYRNIDLFIGLPTLKTPVTLCLRLTNPAHRQTSPSPAFMT